MVQSASKLLTFEEFLSQYGDEPRYELIDGEIIDMEPTGPHEEVAAFISQQVNVEIVRQNLTYFLPHRCLIKPLSLATGFRPDVIILDKAALVDEPLWKREPVITLGKSIKLVVEVVSTNWQNDYARKTEDYSAMGIPEFWIADYLGLGGREYIGSPKQPTFSVYKLDASGEYYQKHQFRGGDLILSQVFPELALTAEQVFQAAT